MPKLFSWFLYLGCVLNSFSYTVKCGTRKNPLFSGLNSRGVNNYEVVVPQRVDEEGKFVSHLIPHRYNKGSTKESDAIFYKLPIAGERVVIQLTPNLKLISPGAVVEIHGKASESYTAKDKMNRMFGNRKINRLKNQACYYTGIVRGLISSKVALSTCSGLAGFIQTGNGTYTIEPSDEYEFSPGDEHPHVLYRNDGDCDKWTGCKFHDSQSSRNVREAKDNGNSGNASVTPYPLYIETLIVTDKSLLAHNQDFDFENYILTVFNMAFSLFHDASLGLLIKLSLVRMIRLEIEEEGMNMNANQDAIKTLQNFQEWQYRINPGDDTHPNHHDIAILITKLDMYSNLSYGFLGVSTLGSVCDKKLSAILCKDNGLRLGFVIAHEIAHLLGAEHDGFNNSCNGIDDDGFRTVMHPQVLLTTETWSKCTQGYFRVLLEGGFGNCLYDEPSEHNFNVEDLLPGTIYDADFQCRQLMTPTARECNEGSTCDSLNCRIPGHLCVLTKIPPAAGTRCGENMWCRQKKCLMVGERPDAVDGNWGDWSAWSECSRTCGSGVSSSERLCNRPVPSHGGRYCLGKSKRHRICSSKPCDMSQPSFRDLQCGEFDDWIYPEDGRKHTWKEYFYHEGNPCILFCINENLEVVALKPRVIDGTSCYKGMRDVCVDGMCMSVPCDLKLESNAIEDVCGVCHGDGTTCDFSQGQQSMEKFPKAMTKLITLPVGTRNIKVEEVMPSAARILVRDKETKDFYVRGIKLGMYHVPGSQAWLGMLKSRQEALTIPGPVTKALTIWIERVENVTVKWSMALPTTQQRKPEFTWDFVRWSPCSAICGPGTQKSEPSCIEEKAGLVESSYCADLEVPAAKIRFCEIAKCEPRWMVTDWKDCENVSSSKVVKKRIVRCVKTVGEGEGESDVIPDVECPPPKPEEEEPCDTRHKRSSAFKRKSSPGLIGYSGDQVMFSSNRIKFGSHKKYDEYLKSFNAIATPQRKSEMIPLHILDTPHFRHYYRVLQSENSSTDSKTRLYLDRALSHATEDTKTKTNSLLSEIYKSTVSGNQQSYNGRDNVMDKSGDETRSLIGARRKKLTPPLRSYSSVNSKRRKQRRRHTFFLPVRYQGENYQKRKSKKFGRLRCRSNIECVILRRGRNRKLLRKRKVSHMTQRKRKYPYWKIHSMNSDKAEYSNQESESVNIFEKPAENYTIRFGQVLLDQDEDADLEIVFEEGDKDDLMGVEGFRSSDRDKVWKLRGEEAIQFMKNITGIDWNNNTTSDGNSIIN